MRRLKTDRSGTKTPVSLMYGKKAGTEKDKNTDEGHDNISHIQLELWANAQNFYLLTISLNSFEISNRVLKFENSIRIRIFSSSLKFYNV